MSNNVYDIGALVIMTARFSDPVSTMPPVDPATGKTLVNPSPGPACVVRKPDGTEVTLAVTAAGTTYSAQIAPDADGTWWYRFATPAGSTYQGASEDYFQVRRRRS